MEFIVGSVKAFVRLCNKKDWSHLPERRFVDWLDSTDVRVEVVGEDETDPIVISGCRKLKTNIGVRPTKQEGLEEESDDEFSSTEDTNVNNLNERRRRKVKRKLDKRKNADQLLFMLEM